MNSSEDFESRIKFDFNSWKEYILNILCLASFIAIIIGLPGKHSYQGKPEIIIAGVCALIFFGLIRWTTDDYILIDLSTNSILVHNKIFFFKSIKYHCAISDILEVRLHSQLRCTKYATYMDFSIHLLLPGNVLRKSLDVVSMPPQPGHQFNDNVRRLRDDAVKLARVAECRVLYSDKIPPKERLQPGDEKQLEESIRVEKIEEKRKLPVPASKVPSPVPAGVIESDFLCVNDKICPSCGKGVPMENIFCNHCGRSL